jgi:hypothetical protein
MKGGAMGVDEIAARLGQYGNELLVMRHHRAEFILRAAADIEEQRDEADAFREQANDLFGHAGAHGGVDHAHHAAPAGECHQVLP